MRSDGAWSQTGSFWPRPCDVLAVQLQAHFLASLGVCFPTCETGGQWRLPPQRVAVERAETGKRRALASAQQMPSPPSRRGCRRGGLAREAVRGRGVSPAGPGRARGPATASPGYRGRRAWTPTRPVLRVIVALAGCRRRAPVWRGPLCLSDGDPLPHACPRGRVLGMPRSCRRTDPRAASPATPVPSSHTAGECHHPPALGDVPVGACRLHPVAGGAQPGSRALLR